MLIPNKKLANEITELPILGERVTNPFGMLQSFLWRRRLKRKKTFIKLKRKKVRNDIYKSILLAVQDDP